MSQEVEAEPGQKLFIRFLLGTSINGNTSNLVSCYKSENCYHWSNYNMLMLKETSRCVFLKLFTEDYLHL